MTEDEKGDRNQQAYLGLGNSWAGGRGTVDYIKIIQSSLYLHDNKKIFGCVPKWYRSVWYTGATRLP